jgi:prepilin-type N-terminal cleavage/methylation domain-containing protein
VTLPRKLKTKNSKGFSLIELMVVILIISLLVAAATVSWKNAQAKGRDSKRKSDLKAVQQALEYYLSVNGKYPNSSLSTPGSKIRCNSGTDTTIIEWGQAFVCDGKVYMQKLPIDYYPTSGINLGYSYYSLSPFKKYILGAFLENNNDPEKISCQAGSSIQYTRYHCVCEPTRTNSACTVL